MNCRIKYNQDMEQKASSEYDSLGQIQQELFNIATKGNNQSFYISIRKCLESLTSKGYFDQSRNLTIEIMKSYAHIPNLVLELSKLLTDEEIINFETWRRTAETDNSEFECPNCGSCKIALSIAKIPIYSRQSTKNLKHNESVSVGLYNYSKHECALCGTEFYRYQQ
ncbi:MAG: hypothetical protein PHW82_12830 [Bacteroidales bacterium]|nr:hypothetical protein [Bacteroidales bacterium]